MIWCFMSDYEHFTDGDIYLFVTAKNKYINLIRYAQYLNNI